jgi:hypothetical protein
MSIQETAQKIKVFLRFPPTDLIIVAIIVLVGVAGFGLGRLSKIEEVKVPITITSVTQELASVGSALPEGGGEVVASKNGTKYHFPWCAGAQQIAEKNKVIFASIQEAKNAGYTPASNCKGLE